VYILERKSNEYIFIIKIFACFSAKKAPCNKKRKLHLRHKMWLILGQTGTPAIHFSSIL